ncbi:protein GrpE [Oceanobacillus oncorhynchi subsp. incaldanensis]|uniref:Protein GrpE n=2 Tax=Oceanobacillus TaxID=182709 RepID=A0A0A1MXT0_9BACI|nr:nucleotide exchange factor GrpE [Oceanobacillus oncorhynchi]MDM8099363.1 nucleotide exchange factor GrpE [Oceanobacillus oncorhynchi]UUI38508.1 nucleotide exchange factor GrpE [Oceanobacillus oncorhynchi]GIO19749.1 protein GrpE [Oceanobacillus oncorhynchi subsp. incaldanensis]CEI84197.1 Protein GrpE [Oceanobacillus oncorhynchi]
MSENEKKEEAMQEEQEIVEETAEEAGTDAETAEENDASEAQIEALKNEKEELEGRMLRLQAEFDNYKRRTLKEREADRKYKAQDMVQELLPVMDNFERALQVEVSEENKSILEGIDMVYRQLKDVFTSQGVSVIETEGADFDPNVHHAVMQIEDDSVEANKVVEELQKGYLLKDRVIRPAMVKVNK